MALQKSYEDEFGTTHSTAYGRITQLHINYESSVASITVGIYKDSTARADNKTPLNKSAYTLSGTDFDTYFLDTVLDTENYNPQERAYVYLKTLDDWSGASDV